jgi:hypothetical protein
MSPLFIAWHRRPRTPYATDHLFDASSLTPLHRLLSSSLQAFRRSFNTFQTQNVSSSESLLLRHEVAIKVAINLLSYFCNAFSTSGRWYRLLQAICKFSFQITSNSNANVFYSPQTCITNRFALVQARYIKNPFQTFLHVDLISVSVSRELVAIKVAIKAPDTSKGAAPCPHYLAKSKIQFPLSLLSLSLQLTGHKPQSNFGL